MIQKQKITKVYLPIFFLVLTSVGLVSSFYLTRINQDIRQQARLDDYPGCTTDANCESGYQCIGHTCLPVPTGNPGEPQDACRISSSSLNSPRLYSSQAYAASNECGSCNADCSITWSPDGGDTWYCYCEPVCSGNKDCTLECSPCGNDIQCYGPSPTNPQITDDPDNSPTPPDTNSPTPTEPDTNTPTPTEPVIGPQCHEVYLYKVVNGQIDLQTGPLTGNMDSELSKGSKIKFRCTNSISNQGSLPEGYSYKFKVSAPCPNNPNQNCVTKGNAINPDNNGSLSKTYTIEANGAHSAQCAVCDSNGNCDWEN